MIKWDIGQKQKAIHPQKKKKEQVNELYKHFKTRNKSF
jgi:ubiquitin